MTTLYEFLYCSTLAPDEPVTAVSAIVSQARALNAEREVTGVLIFDGQRFCQHFEGPRKAAIKLMEAIHNDPRHVGVEVVHHGDLAKRRYREFNMGYALDTEAEEIPVIQRLDGETALARFLELLPRFDVAQ